MGGRLKTEPTYESDGTNDRNGIHEEVRNEKRKNGLKRETERNSKNSDKLDSLCVLNF